mgnify:CR=1 FL=1
MFATLCSRPIATKAEMGGQMPRTLPGRDEAAPAFHTATHTSQLAITARRKHCVYVAAAAAAEHTISG